MPSGARAKNDECEPSGEIPPARKVSRPCWPPAAARRGGDRGGMIGESGRERQRRVSAAGRRVAADDGGYWVSRGCYFPWTLEVRGGVGWDENRAVRRKSSEAQKKPPGELVRRTWGLV